MLPMAVAVLPRRRCDTLCTSGLVDDLFFGYNWPWAYSGMNFSKQDQFSLSNVYRKVGQN